MAKLSTVVTWTGPQPTRDIPPTLPVSHPAHLLPQISSRPRQLQLVKLILKWDQLCSPVLDFMDFCFLQIFLNRIISDSCFVCPLTKLHSLFPDTEHDFSIQHQFKLLLVKTRRGAAPVQGCYPFFGQATSYPEDHEFPHPWPGAGYL